MLPGFRLILATFLLSFVLVFASLRLVDSARVTQEPFTGPHAVLPQGGAPVQLAGIFDREDTPEFNVRFAGVNAPTPIPASLTQHALDRAKEHSPQPFTERFPEAAPLTAPDVDAPGAPAKEVVVEDSAPQPRRDSSVTEPAAPGVLAVAALPNPEIAIVAGPAAVAPEAPPAVTAIVGKPPAPEPAAAEVEPLPSVEPAPDTRVEIAALPAPAESPLERSIDADFTASIDPDRRPPEAVPTAGTTMPAAAPPLPRAKPKAARPAPKPVQVRAMRPRTTAPAAVAPATNPLQSLFGNAAQ